MNKSLVLLLALVIVLSMGVMGCGNGDITPSDTQTPAATTDSETPEAPTGSLNVDDNAALARGNILTVSTTSLNGQFNPVMTDNLYDTWVVNLVFEGLITNDAKGNPIPAAAADWEISEDKRVYTFHLADGMTFHDGEPVTAQDVAFTYYTMADPNYDGPFSYAVADIVGVDAYQKYETDAITGIKVIDESTISFEITSPNVQKIWDFSYGIMPEHVYRYDNWETFKAMVSNPIGSGIMKFDAFKIGDYVQLSANEKYFKGSTAIDGVIIKIQPIETATAALAAGGIDLVNPSASLDNYDMMISTGIANVQEFTGNGYNYIGFNLRSPKLSDKRVRQALAYGLNRKVFIENQWEGFASVCNAPISPVSWAYPDPSLLNDYAYDPAKAQVLLDEAGWIDTDGDGIREKDGIKLSLVWTAYNDVDWPMNFVAMAQENWKTIGVELEADLMGFTAASEKVFNQQDFELWSMGWSLAIDPDPTGVFDKASDVLGGYNAGGYSNARAEEIFKEGNTEYDQATRAELYQEWAIIANDELPYLFNAYRNEIWGVNKRVKGMKLGPYYDWTYTIKDMTLDFVQ
ncbi:peptide ABC transporter [Fusibacter paucivorans]|uniref:Peptide ABC transporter n=1 Tax=Fusibacter paucivorans TaxID=76009 RepID=A0ABS5PKV8_9FIRM|nr:ABC transporter substrate-binding protein [Fusibacter paucivorans]MBS7525502.1 peptide ABC transporter [Fusibacter paucivorans]